MASPQEPGPYYELTEAHDPACYEPKLKWPIKSSGYGAK